MPAAGLIKRNLADIFRPLLQSHKVVVQKQMRERQLEQIACKKPDRARSSVETKVEKVRGYVSHLGVLPVLHGAARVEAARVSRLVALVGLDRGCEQRSLR